MQKALVSAKTEKVKDIKKKSNKRKRNKLFLKMFLIFLIVFLIALTLNTIYLRERYSFTDPVTGIVFESKGFHAKDGFRVFSKDENYLVVFNSFYEDENYLSNITESVIYLQSMLSAKNKSTVLVIAVSDFEKNILTCQSNLGDVYENIELSRDECLDLIYDTEKYSVIFVDYPFSEYTLSKVRLNLSEKIVSINPSSKEDVYFSIVLLINEMFDDAPLTEQNLELINQRIRELTE